MTNKEILLTAMQQSAIDSNCQSEDFTIMQNKVVLSQKNKKARKYLDLPFYCDLTSYGKNIVASVSEECADFTEQYINKYPVEHCFETPNLHVLNEELRKRGMAICFMAEYFLPDINELHSISCAYETKVLGPKDFACLYLPAWSNALCEKRKELDVLAVGAFKEGELIGLAGCSADCETMWQIGIDVLPEYRNQGIASALTSQLAIEVINRDIVPFYCCAWSNLKSVKNALRSGFKPAWVQMTAKSIKFIEEINQ
ncbi:GNAT family N-acetyltransferase [Scatolibacter rhodanostii]|uniref:GNAT family N-acetyltransferase n=1 Tax=Scatolibacter rhodanostii TaxID=2014781 RepID=UPI000C078296|nr:GNAT family N-acetyltransferase [Scatolibacter rhodanostii]